VVHAWACAGICCLLGLLGNLPIEGLWLCCWCWYGLNLGFLLSVTCLPYMILPDLYWLVDSGNSWMLGVADPEFLALTPLWYHPHPLCVQVWSYVGCWLLFYDLLYLSLFACLLLFLVYTSAAWLLVNGFLSFCGLGTFQFLAGNWNWCYPDPYPNRHVIWTDTAWSWPFTPSDTDMVAGRTVVVPVVAPLCFA
jgi:hypothetical protein